MLPNWTMKWVSTESFVLQIRKIRFRKVKWLSPLTQQLSEFSNHSLGQCFPAQICNTPGCLIFPKVFHEIHKKHSIEDKYRPNCIFQTWPGKMSQIHMVPQDLAKHGKVNCLVNHCTADLTNKIKTKRWNNKISTLLIFKYHFILCLHHI